MPNRMLRDWTGSEKINILSVHAERFFIRLIMKVDDYGCFWADTRLLKANLFPLLLDAIREADMLRWMAECQKAGLIVLYERAGKKYVQIVDFRQRLDRAKSKFPLPEGSFTTVNDLPPEVEGNLKGKEVEGPPDFKPDGRQSYNAEETVLGNMIEFNRICISTGKDEVTGREVLHKYHLHQAEKDLYPMARKGTFAGFEKWMRNEKFFNRSKGPKGMHY